MILLDALGWANVVVNSLLALFAAISTILACRAARSAAEQIQNQRDREIERRARAVTVSWRETVTFNGQGKAESAPMTTYQVTIDNAGELPLNEVFLLCPPKTEKNMKNHQIGILDDGRVAFSLGNLPARSQTVIEVDVETCETRVSESQVTYAVRPVDFDLQFRDVDSLWWRTSMGCDARQVGEQEGKLGDRIEWYLMVPTLTTTMETD